MSLSVVVVAILLSGKSHDNRWSHFLETGKTKILSHFLETGKTKFC